MFTCEYLKTRSALRVKCFVAGLITPGIFGEYNNIIGSSRFICEENMVAVRNRPNQISYCRCCNRHVDGLGVPLDFSGAVTCQRNKPNGTYEGNSGGQNWTAEIRTVVKLANHVHSVACQSCIVRYSNPLPDCK